MPPRRGRTHILYAGMASITVFVCDLLAKSPPLAYDRSPLRTTTHLIILPRQPRGRQYFFASVDRHDHRFFRLLCPVSLKKGTLNKPMTLLFLKNHRFLCVLLSFVICKTVIQLNTKTKKTAIPCSPTHEITVKLYLTTTIRKATINLHDGSCSNHCFAWALCESEVIAVCRPKSPLLY